MKPILKLVLPTFENYARRHGYAVRLGTGREAGGRPTSWSKIPLIRALFECYDEVLWLDADAVILDDRRDIGCDLPPTAFQGLVEIQEGDERHINMGVWYLRRGHRAYSFLDALWNHERFIEHPWWENAAALDLLGYSTHQPLRRVRPSEWWDGTTLLPREWNSYYHAPTAGAIINHYAGVRNSERDRLIRADLGKPSPTAAAMWQLREPGHRVIRRLRKELRLRTR